MSPCVCTHELAAHSGYRPGREGGVGCLAKDCSCKKYVAAPRNNGNMSKAEIEIIERKTRAMIALGEEVLNRLAGLKAQ